jgi:hypothetical protein
VALHDFSANGQAHARSFVLAPAMETLKRFEDEIHVLLGKSYSIVLNENLVSVIHRPTVDLDFRVNRRKAKLDRIGDKILKKLPQLMPVSVHCGQRRDIKTCFSLLNHQLQIVGCFTNHVIEFNGLEGSTFGRDTGITEQSFKQALHPISGRFHTEKIIPSMIAELIVMFSPQQASKGLDLSQRFLQVMRGDKSKILKLCVEHLQVVCARLQGLIGTLKVRSPLLNPLLQFLVRFAQFPLSLLKFSDIDLG